MFFNIKCHKITILKIIIHKYNYYMGLIKPKTDWHGETLPSGEYIGDYFNLLDYNRIVNNLKYLKEKFIEFNKPSVALVGFDELDFTSLAYADTFNKLEENLESIIKAFGGLRKLLGDKKTYYSNDKTIDFTELNRIESIIEEIDKLLPIEYRAKTHLEFSLGLNNIGEFSTIAGGM